MEEHPTYGQIMDELRIPASHRTYQHFLKSRYWWTCKQRVLQRDGGRCRWCGSSDSVEVHHLSYRHHGNEANHLEDLVTLCRMCHASEHGKPPERGSELMSPSSLFGVGG